MVTIDGQTEVIRARCAGCLACLHDMAWGFCDAVHAGREGLSVDSGQCCSWLRHGRRSDGALRRMGGASRSGRDSRRRHGGSGVRAPGEGVDVAGVALAAVQGRSRR